MQAMIRRTSANGYRGCAAALAHLNYGHRLGEIKIPTLLICGSEDHGAPPENTRQMHAAMTRSRFVEIEQVGHISNIEQPRIFAEAVIGFLGDVDRSGTALAAG
jgi:3-oxoadipate enol-lactonase